MRYRATYQNSSGRIYDVEFDDIHELLVHMNAKVKVAPEHVLVAIIQLP